METLIFILAVLSTFLTARYFSFVGTQLYLYSLRDSLWIERFRQCQKAGDIIIASYNATSALTHLWGTIMLASYLYSFHMQAITIISITGVISMLLIIQFICRYFLEKKFNLRELYDMVVKYRRNQEVVGEDNDYEVRYIQTYVKIMSEKWWNVIWIAYISTLCLFII